MSLDTASAVAILRSLTAKFDKSVLSVNPFYPTLCTVQPSDGADEQYGWIGDMPGIREWLGDRQFDELRAAHFTLANKHWESSVGIEKTKLRDDRMGMYGPILEKLGREAAMHPDELLFSTLVAGESTACFDGQYFFDTDHSWGDSGSQSNDLTYNASDHTAVTSTEFRAAFHAARAAMVAFKNDKGKLLNRPTIGAMSSFLVLVPSVLRLAAEEGLNATLVGGGNSNVVLDKPRIVECPYLTDGTKFYLFNLADTLKPFVFQAREPISRQTKGLDDIETKFVKFMTEARYNIGYLAWWTGVLTTFN